jgi:peptidoglycan/LPS O-acetylase OafA/YrhL
MFFLPGDFIDFSKSVLYSLGFSSNLYFWFSGLKYGAQSGLNPFLHTWSLSVEEQFYLIFPVLLFFIYQYFKKYLIQILILGFIISLVLADWGSRNYPAFTFYILPTRGWELLSGSILAYFEIKLGRRSKSQTLNKILPSIGFFLIIYSISFFDDKMNHPSFYTLLPIIGVCLIIWFSNKDELITRILSSKLLVGIGLISYSLYLWHYPFVIFDSLTEFTTNSNLRKILLGIIILLLSITSYFFIEIPARKKIYKFKIILTFILISIFICFIFNFKVIINDGYKNRLPKILQENIVNKYSRNLFGSDNDFIDLKKKVYLIGDSHMGFIGGDLVDSLFKKNYKTISFVEGGCLFFPGFNQYNVKTNRVNDKCNDNYFAKIEKTLSQETDAIFIFGGRFPIYLTNYYFDNQEGGLENEGSKFEHQYISNGNYINIQDSFKTEILKKAQRNKIILIYPIPEVGWDPNRKIYLQYLNRNNKFSNDFNLKYITTSYEVYKSRTRSSFALLDSIVGQNIYRVYPHEVLCNNLIKNRCSTHDDKDIFYADDDHLSLKGSKMINQLIINEIEKIEKNIK